MFTGALTNSKFTRLVEFLCIAQIIVDANVFTGALTNSKFTRLVEEKYQ